MDTPTREKIYAVLDRGLDLKARLKEDFASLKIHQEQQTLRSLLQGIPDRREPERQNQTAFLGLRYPLVCWLDEIFIMDSDWSVAWNESKLEWAMFDQANRAFRFWEQQQLAEDRADLEAVEVFFLCVVLGFRGDLGTQPERLSEKVQSMARALGEKGSWSGPLQRTPRTAVPPLSGNERKQQMFLVAGISIIVFVFVVVFAAVLQFGR